jgi:molybdenum cofactor biosynthesis enzyme MoaA
MTLDEVSADHPPAFRLGSVLVTLSGGEPLLRKDLEEIAASFDDRGPASCSTPPARV